MGNRTLIAYETKSGATEESAQKILQVLRSKYQLDGDIVDLKEQKNPDIATYSNIIVGGGVRAGKVYDKPQKFLEHDFNGKKVAFYISSGDAGTPEKYADAKAKFLESTLAKYPKITPIATEAFGGHAKILGKTIVDNLDIGRVGAWADELGKKFTE
jgi:menaquinone-dependent protoporphyrinogen IX oxidase